MKTIKKSKQTKGKMAREIVQLCIRHLVITSTWAKIVKTISVFTGIAVDLSDVLVFDAGVFAGELLMLLFKRIFAKDKEETE